MSSGFPPPIDADLDMLASKTVPAIFEVHKQLGPGLLESVYERCLVYELELRGLRVQRQVPLPIVYKKIRFDEGLRLDLLIGGKLVVELKTVQSLEAIHMTQILTYLKLSRKRLGLLVNFNVSLIKDGIKRVVL